MQKIFVIVSDADPDPESGAFLIPRSVIRDEKNSIWDPGWKKSRIRDPGQISLIRNTGHWLSTVPVAFITSKP
jgi:hypothetical protein